VCRIFTIKVQPSIHHKDNKNGNHFSGAPVDRLRPSEAVDRWLPTPPVLFPYRLLLARVSLYY